MADDLIHCPSCGFQLRLPPDLYGQSVECPQCHTRFTAPVPSAIPEAGRAPPGREYDATARPVPDEYGGPVAVRADGGPLTAPAICLLIVSLLGVAADAYWMIGVQDLRRDPAEFQAVLQKEFNKNKDLTPEQRRQVTDMFTVENVILYGVTGCGTMLVLNLLTALGAVQMLRRRGYWLAVLGCVLALNPVNVPSCLLQVPFGIWGLIVVLSESGRRAFR